MMNWMLMPYRRYFDFAGRSRPMEYWMFMLFVWIVNVVVALTGLLIDGGRIDYGYFTTGYGTAMMVSYILLGLFSLFNFIPALAVSVRRFHDRNHTGWLFFLLSILTPIPFLGFATGLAIFVIMVLPGTVGPNRYGPDPRGYDPLDFNTLAHERAETVRRGVNIR